MKSCKTRWACSHSDDGEAKAVIHRDPERCDLLVVSTGSAMDRRLQPASAGWGRA